MHGGGYVYLVKSHPIFLWLKVPSFVIYLFLISCCFFYPFNCHFCAVYSNSCIDIYHYVPTVKTQPRTRVLMNQSIKQILSSTIYRLTRRVSYFLVIHIYMFPSRFNLVNAFNIKKPFY